MFKKNVNVEITVSNIHTVKKIMFTSQTDIFLDLLNLGIMSHTHHLVCVGTSQSLCI